MGSQAGLWNQSNGAVSLVEGYGATDLQLEEVSRCLSQWGRVEEVFFTGWFWLFFHWKSPNISVWIRPSRFCRFCLQKIWLKSQSCHGSLHDGLPFFTSEPFSEVRTQNQWMENGNLIIWQLFGRSIMSTLD